MDQLRSAGSDLSKPHQIEFCLYLPSEADAEAAEDVLAVVNRFVDGFITIALHKGPGGWRLTGWAWARH